MYTGCDLVPTMLRSRRMLGQMLRDYQNLGTYTDFNGKVWNTAIGIVLAWEQYEKEFGDIKSEVVR